MCLGLVGLPTAPGLRERMPPHPERFMWHRFLFSQATWGTAAARLGTCLPESRPPRCGAALVGGSPLDPAHHCQDCCGCYARRSAEQRAGIRERGGYDVDARNASAVIGADGTVSMASWKGKRLHPGLPGSRPSAGAGQSSHQSPKHTNSRTRGQGCLPPCWICQRSVLRINVCSFARQTAGRCSAARRVYPQYTLDHRSGGVVPRWAGSSRARPAGSIGVRRRGQASSSSRIGRDAAANSPTTNPLVASLRRRLR